MPGKYQFADLHCHPTLKTFGHSFSPQLNGWGRHHVWHNKPPTALTKTINRISGLTKFTQADFTTMAKGNVRIACVSLYPFEKGFFINGQLNGPISASLANLITGIGYHRVRHLQKHTNYFEDLNRELAFLNQSCRSMHVGSETWNWKFASQWKDVEEILAADHQIAVILTIEGAHILNSGLTKYGHRTDPAEVLQNVSAIKAWDHPPFFITFAHNFSNDLCGHARSLEQLGPLVNQNQQMNEGFTDVGYQTIHALLSTSEGKRILIDVKHMSLRSRLQYYELLKTTYKGTIPIIVSHGSVAGCSANSNSNSNSNSKSNEAHANTSTRKPWFVADDINFFDEELVEIAKSGGCFALQLDSNRLAVRKHIRKDLFKWNRKICLKKSAGFVWAHLQHIAEVLDRHGLYAWGTMQIGSDFDGTTNPLEGVWTAEFLPQLADGLHFHAHQYLEGKNPLTMYENKSICAEEVVDRFVFTNAVNFLRKYFS